MQFVLCLDSGFVMPTGVALRSLSRFLSEADQVAILHVGLTDKDVADLRACGTPAHLTFFPCDDMRMDASWIPPAQVSKAAFLRYFAPELLAGQSRCVYLDGDVLVRHDPRSLFNIDLHGHTLAAVQSRVTPFLASKGGVAAWREVGLASTAPYFNSGVLVIDLDRWRERGVTASITNYLSEHGARANLADQEALNVAVYGDWLRLDRTWNYVTYIADYFLQAPEDEPHSPSIAHFAGREKPWSHQRAPLFTDEWFHILEGTPWAQFTPAVNTRRHPLWKQTLRRVLHGLASLARS